MEAINLKKLSFWILKYTQLTTVLKFIKVSGIQKRLADNIHQAPFIKEMKKSNNTDSIGICQTILENQ